MRIAFKPNKSNTKSCFHNAWKLRRPGACRIIDPSTAKAVAASHFLVTIPIIDKLLIWRKTCFQPKTDQMRTKTILSAIFFTVSLPACFTPSSVKVGSVGAGVYLNTVSEKEMAEMPIALYIEEDLRKFIEISTPSTMHGMNRSYEFDVGEGIAPLIEKSMKNIFKDIEISDAEPTEESLKASGRAGVLRIGLNGTVIDLQFEPQFVGANARTNYMIDLGIEFTDLSGNILFRSKARGSGFSTVQTSDTGGSSFVDGIDLAIQEAVDKLGEIVLSANVFRQYSPAAPKPPASAEPAPAVAGISEAAPAAVAPPKLPEQPERDDKQCPATDTKSSRARVRDGIKFLHSGKPDEAKRELTLALCQDAENTEAKEFIRQIDASRDELLGDELFKYTVRPGDSLSRIAEQFLNDPMKFYLLAKINGITEPGMLSVGRTIEIPLPKDAARRMKNADMEPPTASIEPAGGSYDAPLKIAIKASDNQDRNPAIHFTTDGTAPSAQSPSYSRPFELKASATVKFIAIDASGNVSRIKSVDFKLKQKKDEAEELFAAGLREAEKGDMGKAYETFSKVLAYNPSHSGALMQIDKIKPDLADQYRKKAKNALRSQDLDKTIEYWDKVLDLYPGDDLARIERTRAVELKNRLKKISQ